MDSRASTAGRLLTLFAFYVLIHWTSGTRPSSGPGALDCAQLLSNSSLNLNSNDLNLAPEGRVVVVRGALACGAKFGQRERVVLNASRVTLQGRPAATDAAIMYWPDWRDAISLQNGAVLKLQSLVLITGEGGFPKRDSESGYSDFSDVVETSEFANFSDFLEICGSGFRKGSIELEDVLVVDGRCGGQGSRGPRWSRKSLRKAAAGLAAVRLIRYCTCPASADGFAIPGGTPPGPSCRALPCSPTAGCSSLGSTNWTAERISQLEIFESAMFYSDGLKSTTTCGGAVLRAEMPVALGAGLAGGGALLAMVTICLWTAFGKRRCKRRKELTKLMDLVGIESPEDESSPGDHEDGSLEGLCLSQVELGYPLGEGGFGKVYMGAFQGKMIAVKIIDHDGTALDAHGVLLEAALSRDLRHPNVVMTYLNETRPWEGARGPPGRQDPKERAGKTARSGPEDGDDDFSYLAQRMRGQGKGEEGAFRTWIVMEYCEGGSLARAVREGALFYDEERVAPRYPAVVLCALDVARAMAHLHGRRVIHGDLKAQNVLLKTDPADQRGFRCKVGDFGLSRASPSATAIRTFTCGTTRYCPPELLRDGLLTPAADVYSFGMLLWELVSGRKAFQDLAQQDIVVAAVAGRRPPVPRHCPSDIRSLIRDCWAADRKERPSFESVVGRLRRLAGTYAPGLAESGPREQAGETKRGVWRPDVNGTDSSFSSDDGRPFVRDVCLAALQSPATGCLRGSLFRLESSSANLWDTPTPCTSESAKDLGARGPAGQSSVNAITDQVEPQPTVGGAAGEATPRGAAETDPPAETVEKDGGSRSKAATTIDVKGGRICDPGTVKRSPQWVAAASADPGQKYGLQNSGKFGKFGKLRKLDRDSDSSESDAASSEGGGQRQCDGQLRAPSAQVPSADLGARPRRPRTASELSAGPKERPQKAAMAIRAAMACEALPGWQGSISAAEGGGRLIAADGGGRLISACRNDYYEVINAFTTSMNGSEEDWPPPPPPVSFDESNTQRVLSRVSEDVEEPRPLSVTPRSPW
ncbi:unnamed protein product [Ostreobium quekettii]|uniref:Protein kinase domain-containing protein n=1 Tax=Ostreobium quekettii TaxID=121088 RepID=A0A8S1IXT4_9CHLO|nr:unnamed protein product [Ostreobium quekettii]